jgi:hypothetical protein
MCCPIAGTVHSHKVLTLSGFVTRFPSNVEIYNDCTVKIENGSHKSPFFSKYEIIYSFATFVFMASIDKLICSYFFTLENAHNN